jgi:RNA polymerase subunit RPABC4/transcription elongation factor Spt4
MAIIKCPECGHQISDKAPTCPSCGVEIAGKITRCPQCGEVYLNDQEACPNCHYANMTPSAPSRQPYYVEPVKPTPAPERPVTEERVTLQDVEDIERQESEEELVAPVEETSFTQEPVVEEEEKAEEPKKEEKKNEKKPKKRTNYSALIVSIVLAMIICAVCFYFYNKAKTEKEAEAFEFAMSSKEPMVLQNYLNTYPDAPLPHRKAVNVHIKELKNTDHEWSIVMANNSKEALLDYLTKNPETPHKKNILQAIDSIDWDAAVKAKTKEAYEAYIKEHPDGKFIDAANEGIKTLKEAKPLTAQEEENISGLFRKFFQSINSKKEDRLLTTINEKLNFFNKADATNKDVVAYMNKLWKPEIANLNWHILKDYNIQRKELENEKYEYDVNFSALLKTEPKDKKLKPTETKYQVTAKVDANKKISAINITKIN